MKDVIAAIATPLGRGAIGIVRMSGGGVLGVLERVWKSRAHPVEKFVTHRLYLGNIVDLSTGRAIDKVLACLMSGPNSYTGEDMVEINCHGGREVLRLVLDQLLKAGARMAGPGEFTKRAFLNGKMDLLQAEAVAALIDSRSAMAARLAEEQLEGVLSGVICRLRDSVKQMLSYVEAAIDFPEEDIKLIREADVGKGIASVVDDIGRLIGTYDRGRVFRCGVKAVICGPPNAGKSSLLNAILGVERAIVHHVPGTTRDTIEEEAIIEGVSFRFVDTAGIREAEEEVEEIGVARSKREATSAEVVLLVVDGHDLVPPEHAFVEELVSVRHVIVVVNKKDIGVSASNMGAIRYLLGPRPYYEVSAKMGEGVDALCRGLVAQVLSGGRAEGLAPYASVSEGDAEGAVITSRRHFAALVRTREDLEGALAALRGCEPPEFVSLYLRRSLDHLGEIVGYVTTEEILDEIFSKFCIGK